jgi:hypothetical protein
VKTGDAIPGMGKIYLFNTNGPFQKGFPRAGYSIKIGGKKDGKVTEKY